MGKKELIDNALREAKDFSKMIRQYLYDISQERPLTEREQEFFDMTHDVHVHTHDAILLLQKGVEI